MSRIALNPRTYMQSQTPTVVQGRGGGFDGPPSLRFVTIFRKDFAFSRKPVMRYILWVAALLGACDIIQLCGCHLGFYRKLQIVKKR